jgi:Mg/Co/Ni transporter MgtE
VELERTLLVRYLCDHPGDAARAVESMPTAEAAALLDALPAEASDALLPRLIPVTVAGSLSLLQPERAASLVSGMPRSRAAAVLRAMRPREQAATVAALDLEVRRAMEPLLRYSEGTAGALMDPAVLSVASSASVAETLERIRKSAQQAMYYVYVVDDEQRLFGVVSMRELMETNGTEPVAIHAKRPVESVLPRASAESVLEHPAWSRFHALPVVSSSGRFLGVIRYETVRALEGSFVEQSVEDRGAETAAALGELYGLGVRGLVEWFASGWLGFPESERGQR